MAEEDKKFDRSLGSIKNLFVTELAKHVRDKKLLRGPFHKLPGEFVFHSWKDHALPLYTWAALAVGLMERDRYLPIFRDIAGRLKYRHDNFSEELYVNHASLKDLSNSQFDFIFEPLLKDSELRSHFAELGLLNSLPDHEHWTRYGTVDEKNETDLSFLASGYAQCIDHQSQQATDIRWMIVMNFLANQRIIFNSHLEERFLTIVEYPNRGDMRSVRPSIRALEIGLRGNPGEKKQEEKIKQHAIVAEGVWDELFVGTNCMPLAFHEPKLFDHKATLAEVFDIYKGLIIHYFDNIATTGIDARLDSAFGLVLYALSLLSEGIALRPYQRLAGRLILRTILETHINLRFLTKKDDETIWFQYRNHGSAQAKLAFLKYLQAKEKPDYVNIQELFDLANEDMWLEYQDINLGNWASKSLRDIAIEAGLKEAYDQHYTILSTTIHAQWTGVREENFTQCINPLHRYHRIPAMPKPSQEDIVPDMCKIINQMLDDLTHLYPQFKDRLRAYRAESTENPSRAEHA